MFFHPTPTLKIGPYILVPHRKKHFYKWSQLRCESRLFLQPWEPLWPEDDLKKHAFNRRIKRYRRNAKNQISHMWLIFDASNDLLGGVSFFNIRQGVSQAVTLGYWMGVNCTGKGIMRQILVGLMSHAASHMGITRFEAATLTNNDRSIRLLNKLGFAKEGIAKQYLRINGKWEDHFLFAYSVRQ